MTEETEREIERLNHGRLLREAGRELLPVLKTMKINVLARIISAHREAEPGKLPAAAAELSVIEELTNRITRNEKETARREEKHYE